MAAGPVTERLATEDEVWCLARFTDPAARAGLEELGVRTYPWELGRGGLEALPDDFTHVMHATHYLGLDGAPWSDVIGLNCIGTGELMAHCRAAEAFLYVSFSAVYSPLEHGHRYVETDPLGGNTPWLPPYATSKVAAEAVVRALSHVLELPATIARLGVVHSPMGWGGFAVRYVRMMLDGTAISVPQAFDSELNPIHTDDIARQVPLLWDVASIGGTILNWGGDEVVTERELLAYITELTGIEARIEESNEPLRTPVATDETFRRSLIGDCEVAWREGVERVIRAHFPDLALELPSRT
jgi:nucleoside-diphosphate-sugar epimerase